ncbi:muscle-specific protein 20 [Eurytemora carolleeae]|uniref:muscle-specific protein 20 n=1 Tax=Eurytemora carolleeae TaxID=1294199 RepID=UPI000C77F747|nr:muscle-specific protein 20 [Eurytemora carolleeae]|eukprot:XP_023335138.1 muscle-specific protein 20-like [Eurytemora affinis]
MPRPVAIKRDAGQEKAVADWIKAVVGEWPEDTLYEDVLKNGVLLCRFMNVLQPGSVTKINTSGANFKLMENITKLHNAFLNYGVDQVDVFQTNDLFEKRDLGAVTNTMFALDRAVGKHPEWTGARLQK